MMRILIKIMLFPVTLALSILVVLLNFIIEYGGALASVIAGLLFTLGMVLIGAKLIGWIDSTTWGVVAIPFVAAFLLSPFGLTGLVALIAGGLDSFNGLLKSI